MILDLYREGMDTVRVMVLDSNTAICLEGGVGKVLHNVDYEKEGGEILILNVLDIEL